MYTENRFKNAKARGSERVNNCSLAKPTPGATCTGPKRWSDNLSLDEDHWGEFFKPLTTLC